MNGTIALDQYRLLGRSGLRVSPLALGTMTFGQAGAGRRRIRGRAHPRQADGRTARPHRPVHQVHDAAHVARLDAVSRPDPIFPQRFVAGGMVQQLIFGGAAVRRPR